MHKQLRMKKVQLTWAWITSIVLINELALEEAITFSQKQNYRVLSCVT